ncbi:MAG TPA: GON domain-containing protein [Hyalangium sp.]|nr:GON domain-containing protein [Hyalangium sp.]
MKSLNALPCLLIGLTTLYAGCGPLVPENTPPRLAEMTQAIEGAPASCQEIKDSDPLAADGHYTLYVDHDPAKPWTAYCHNMAGTPAEYLTLLSTGESVNFSQYTATSSQGSNVRTRYTKIRIDPVTLKVHIADQTFSSSTGQLRHGSVTVTSMPYAVAMSCNQAPSGVANLDLRGTPFDVASGAFMQAGSAYSGTSSYSRRSKVVNLTGGGYCGWTSPTPYTLNPFNQNGGFQLSLVYRAPPAFPDTCEEAVSSHFPAPDGDYTLYIGYDPAKPWTAYCHNMAGTPAEYLTLVNTGDSVNFSQYTATPSQGSNVRTRYTKIRIDPITLKANIADQAFSSSTGQLRHGSVTVTSMPYGVAMSCNQAPSGVGNIDLSGTSFKVAPNAFMQAGTNYSGTNVYSSADKVVSLTGGGYCGWTSSTPYTLDPFNQRGGFQLALVYDPPAQP